MKFFNLLSILLLNQYVYGQCILGNCQNGNGKMIYSDGGIYEGSFQSGKWHGYGEVKWPSGSSYKGDFKNGQKHGTGIYNYYFGDVFEGEYVNGEFTKGKYTWKSGDVFEGEFFYGKKIKGTYYFVSGDKYIGGYVNGYFSGFGVYYFANGDIYEGEFQNGRFNGKGKKTMKNGQILEGIWQNDVLKTNQEANDLNHVDVASSETENDKIILYGYDVGNWAFIDNSYSFKCGICNKNCSVKRAQVELDNEKNEKKSKILKDLSKDLFMARLNYYRNKPNPSVYTFENYLEENNNANKLNLYKSSFTYYNIFYDPFFVGYYCSEAHLNSVKVKFDKIAERNRINQSNISSNSSSSNTNQLTNSNKANSKTNNQKQCVSCSGSGLCKNCNRVFKFKEIRLNRLGKVDGWDFTDEKRLGYVKHTNCTGHGHTSFETGQGFESSPCKSSLCQGGWESCNRCSKSGKCSDCKGSGFTN